MQAEAVDHRLRGGAEVVKQQVDDHIDADEADADGHAGLKGFADSHAEDESDHEEDDRHHHRGAQADDGVDDFHNVPFPCTRQAASPAALRCCPALSVGVGLR